MARAGQFLFSGINHSIDFARRYANDRFHARFLHTDRQILQQFPDVSVGTVTVMALESTQGPGIVWLEIGRAIIGLMSMLRHPRAGDVMLTAAER